MVCLLIASLIAFGWLLPPAGWAQQAKQAADSGRETGKVVAYGSIENDTMDLIAAAFTKRTGTEVEYWRASSTKVMDRVLGEMRAGKPRFDVVLTNDAPMEFMRKEGAFAKYDSPSAKGFLPGTVDPHLGPRYRDVLIGIVYHAGIVKKTDAPGTLEDLLKPQYRGKLVMPDPSQHTTTAQWLASLHKILGTREQADRFIRALAATRPLLVESLTPSGERITTGETPIGISFIKNVVFYGKKGIPIDYARMGRFMGDGHYVAVGAKAPNPKTARAFVDFFLGEEALRLMAGVGEWVNRKGIYPPIPDADKIETVTMVELDKAQFAEKMAEFRKIFLR